MSAGAVRGLVVDTNVALDLLLFQDPSAAALGCALQAGRLRWLALPAMRAEFARVLDYPRIARWRAARGRAGAPLLAAYDAACRPCPPVPPAPVRCTDPDDQPFLDLAVAHRALLLSRDHAVLAQRGRLSTLGVDVLERFVTNTSQA